MIITVAKGRKIKWAISGESCHFLTRFDINQAVQLQKLARCLGFYI